MNGPSIRQLDTPAQLQTATDVTTAQGGRTRSWTTLTTLWLQFQPAAGMEISEPGLPPRRREAATAIARDNPALQRGTRLLVGSEAPWQVIAVHRRDPGPGFVSLSLQREA